MDMVSRRNAHESYKKADVQMVLPIVIAVIAVLLVAGLCYLIWGNIHASLTLEAGSVLTGDDFLVVDMGMSVELADGSGEVDMSHPGDYIVKLRYHGVDFYSTLRVVDTMGPVVTVQNATVYTNKLPDPGIFVQQVQDGTDVTVTYVQEPDMSTLGEQEVQLCFTDEGGNSVFTTAKMKIYLDEQAPQILGVRELSIYQGSTISYRNGVVVQDDYDENPKLTIDSSSVDLSQPGIYNVTYHAQDAAGNLSTVKTTLTVAERTENYVEESVIYAAADAVLANIIRDSMTDEEKVEAVYNWVVTNCTYKGNMDKTDKLQAAYQMLNTYIGDCYNFYAVCSVLFDRLGFPNLEVKRSEDSVRPLRHWWNMVSIDGGKTFYHVDTCPQTDFEVKICMATDAEVNACNQYQQDYYAYDTDIYPTTPAE